VIIVGDRGG